MRVYDRWWNDIPRIHLGYVHHSPFTKCEPAVHKTVFVVPSRHLVLRPVVRHLSLSSLPVVRGDDEDILVEFLTHLEEYARNLGAIELSIDGGRGFPAALRSSGFDLTERIEFELDLTNSEQDLWRAMEHSRRKNI